MRLSVKDTQTIDLVIRLEDWDKDKEYDRLGLEENYTEYLGNKDDIFRSIFSFTRHSKDGKKNLLFVCNFTPVDRPDYRVGVPRRKQFKLVLNSDETKYGGSGEERPLVYKPEKQECDGQKYSFAYPLPGYGVAVFEY